MKSGAQFQAGFGRAEITPPLGAPLRGYYHERLMDGVLDPLFARATVWQSGSDRIVLVSCDLCCIEGFWSAEARKRAAARANVPVAQVMICATHTHTGPLATEAVARVLIRKVEEAVAAAIADLSPCRVSQASSKAPPLAFNRRYHLRDGSVMTNPNVPLDQIKGPAGPVDETVNVLFFDRPDGSRRAVLVHYGLHVDTVGGNKASSDWPAVIERELRGIWKNQELHAQFMLAPCGDVNHFDCKAGRMVKGAGESRRIGRALAVCIDRAAASRSEVQGESISASEAAARVPLYKPGSEELERAKAVLAQSSDPEKDFTLPVVEAAKIERTARIVREKGESLEVAIQALHVGNWSAAAVPMELFVDVGRAMAASRNSPRPWIVTLANDSLGYVPGSEAYKQGGYEVVSSNFLPSAPEILVAHTTQLLNRTMSAAVVSRS